MSSPDSIAVWEHVRAAQQGDQAAFGLLYDHYVDTVYRFLFYRLGRDRQLAEDLTSETFLRALRNIGSVHDIGRDPGAWFITIARNLSYDHFKSARTRLEYSTDLVPERDSEAPGPESLAIGHFEQQAVRTALAKLNAEQQQCIALRFGQELSLAETAAAMGKKENAIKALQHRAVKRLAQFLAESDSGSRSQSGSPAGSPPGSPSGPTPNVGRE